jgi:hypothetical protein
MEVSFVCNFFIIVLNLLSVDIADVYLSGILCYSMLSYVYNFRFQVK